MTGQAMGLQYRDMRDEAARHEDDPGLAFERLDIIETEFMKFLSEKTKQ